MAKLSERQRTQPTESVEDRLPRLRLEVSLVADWNEPPDWILAKDNYRALLEFEQEVLTERRLFQRIDLR